LAAVTLGGCLVNSLAAIVNTNAYVTVNKTNGIASSLVVSGGAVKVQSVGGVASNTNVIVNLGSAAFTYSPLDWNANNTINNLTLNNNNTAVVSSKLTVNGVISATGNSTILGAAGINQPELDLGATAKTIQTVGAADYLTIQPAMLNGTFNKIGAGTLELLSTNSFMGQNVVSGGTLRGYTTSIGNDVLNSSVVELLGGSYGGVISGPGAVAIENNVEYQSLNTYGGGTTIKNTASLEAEPQYLHGSIVGNPGSQLYLDLPTSQTLTATLGGTLGVSQMGTGVATLSNTSTMAGQYTVSTGGLRASANNPIGTATLYLSGPFVTASLEAVGAVAMPNHVFFNGDVDIVGSGTLNVTSATAKNTMYALSHNSTGSTTISGKFALQPFSTLTVNSGQLTLGDAATIGGFTSSGSITVNSGGTLTLKSLNFISLPDVSLAGGTLNTANGYAIPLGAALQGNGSVTGRVASANGSSLIATGALSLGDAAHVAGVNLDGELYTNQYTVNLLDSNQAVLGSLTQVGTPSADGTLSSPNGYVLNFGRNIAGRGQIQSNNTLADAVIINGDVSGDSSTNVLEFTGYVKGVGMFNNVAFSGTFSPGLSPTLMTIGNTAYLPSNVLEMELGGLTRGTQYDAFDITNGSLMQLNGQLKISLISAFSPSLGDQFLLFQGLDTGAFAGTFSSYDFPTLAPGLAWDASLLYSNGILQVVNAVPEPFTLLPVAIAALAFCGRSRRGVRTFTA